MEHIFENKYLIIDSQYNAILFQSGAKQGLQYSLLNSSNEITEWKKLHQETVLKYSVYIDKTDRIHVIILTKSGQLNYYLYKDNKWSRAPIANFDFHSNIYGQLNILTEGDAVNLIYSYANIINTDLWTILHVVSNKEAWNKYRVISLMAEKNFINFHFDMDSHGSIHLLYNSVERNKYQINYLYYNSYIRKWNPLSQKLSQIDTNSILPYILADTKDNLHALWFENINGNKILRYSRLLQRGDNKFIWMQRKIPHIQNRINSSIIVEEKGVLKIIYLTEKKIGFIYSSDGGSNWNKGDELEVNTSEIISMKVSQNLIELKNVKINHAYCRIDKALDLYFLNSIRQVDRNTSNDLPQEEEIYKTDDKEPIRELNGDYDRLLENQEEIRDLIFKSLIAQNKINSKIEDIYEVLDRNKNSILYKLFNFIK